MKRLLLLLAMLPMLAVGCKNDVVNLIMETDIGNDIDDVIAMDFIYKNGDAGRVNLLGVCINKEGARAGEFVDILNTWYGHPEVPIGIIHDGAPCDAVKYNYTRKVASMTNEDGSPAFERSLGDHDNFPEAPILYRKLLAKAKNHSVVIASVGFSTNLARLLDTPADEYSPLTGKELVARKVKFLSTMAGNFINSDSHEYNVVIDIPAAQKVFSEWPTPVVTSPWELGAEIKYPAESIDNDFSWAGGLHPLVEAYYHYQPRPYNSPTWDPTAVLYAIEGDKWFNVSEPGFIKVTDEGSSIFTPDEKGNRRYLMVTQEQKDAIRDHFVEVVTTPPAVFTGDRSIEKVSATAYSSEFIYETAPFPSCHASTVLETKDGLLAAWFGGPYESHPEVCIYSSSKTAEGWTEPVLAADGIVSKTERYPCWNPVLYRLDNGDVALFYKVGPNPRAWWGEYKISKDEGKTWGERIPLPEGILGPIKNKPVRLEDGSVLCPTSVEFTPDKWRVFMETADRDLAGWTRTEIDCGPFNAIQPTILFHEDSLRILCRTQEGVVASSASVDGGKSWSPLKATSIPNNNSGIDGVTLDDELQLLVCNPLTKGRNKLVLKGSYDGAEWKDLLTLEDEPAGEFSYPAIIRRKNGMIEVTYTYNREKIKHRSIVINTK